LAPPAARAAPHGGDLDRRADAKKTLRSVRAIAPIKVERSA
jgi:hypothetical protein